MDRKRLYMGSFFDYFMVIYDLRQEGKVQHKLMDILFITIAATVCRCNEWHEKEDWAIMKEEWLRQYLKLPMGFRLGIQSKGYLT